MALKSGVLLERLKAAYKAFTLGNFSESRKEFDFILHAVPLVVGETRAEGNELKEVGNGSKELKGDGGRLLQVPISRRDFHVSVEAGACNTVFFVSYL